MNDIVARFTKIKEKIRLAPEKFHLVNGKHTDVKIIAVSKTHGQEKIEPLLAAGHRMFGENRVQEAGGKWPTLKEKYPDTELHLIGPLQTNKAREAVQLFDVIQTVDREKLARELKKEFIASGRSPDCFIQVNTGEEKQKAGIAPRQTDDFISLCINELELPIIGLMCIPPVDEDPAPHFALLKTIAERNGIKNLSMGMSSDFELAAAMGATHVRVGSAIFGERG